MDIRGVFKFMYTARTERGWAIVVVCVLHQWTGVVRLGCVMGRLVEVVWVVVWAGYAGT